MHEFALIQDMIEEVLSRMKAHDPARVKVVELNVGESSGYSAESLRQAYDVLTEGTPLGDAELVVTPSEGSDVVLRRLVLEE